MDRAPVGHHHPVVGPLALEDVGQEVAVVGGVGPVDPVVGGHDGPGIGGLHGHLEGGQVELAQGALVDLGAHGHAGRFLVVDGVVLERGADPLALQTLDVGGPQGSGQERILRIGLEVTAPVGDAHNVDGRGQDHAVVQRQSLAANGGGDLASKVRVPGGGHGHADGKHRRHLALVGANAGGAVGHAHRRHAQALDAVEGEGGRSGHQRHLLLQGQARQQILDPGLQGRVGVAEGLAGRNIRAHGADSSMRLRLPWSAEDA